jgi:Bacterial PH domain
MGERIKCTGGLHAIFFWAPVILGLCILPVVLPIELAIGIESIIVVISCKLMESTKIIVTDKRLLLKKGIILTKTIQFNINQIESSEVDWTILGKLLNYGTIIISCSGGRIECIRNVANPLRIQEKLVMY